MPVPYDQMKSQCEALVSGKQQKMLVLHSFKNQHDSKALVVSGEKEMEVPASPSSVSMFIPWKEHLIILAWPYDDLLWLETLRLSNNTTIFTVDFQMLDKLIYFFKCLM